MSDPKRLEAAASYTLACAVLRDGKRLLDIGFAAATVGPLKILCEGPETLEDAIISVAAKEAEDLIEWFAKDPKGNTGGDNAASAFKESLKVAKRRYARGKCYLCKGPALPCAKRHMRGMSCA